jgi:peptidoglycan hydrolase CwlO-like protein
MTDPASTDQKVTNLQSRRYNSVNMDVASLNDQINEIVANTEELEADIEVAEQRIRNAKKQIAKNEKDANKLRLKRQIVAKAAFDIASQDQP